MKKILIRSFIALFIILIAIGAYLGGGDVVEPAGPTAYAKVVTYKGEEKPRAYINMYVVEAAEENTYEGTLLQTVFPGEGFEAAIFPVRDGTLVEFVSFEDKAAALADKSRTFTTLPYKNVAGKVCEFDGITCPEQLRVDL